jgi:Transglutaminase-like superfamily
LKGKIRRRKYLREAASCLLIARLAIRLLPPHLVLKWADRSPRRICRFSGYEIGWVSWAVEAAGANKWIGAVCLPRALAAQTMLRRRGIASQLCLGVARVDGTLHTHAWVEIGTSIIVGETERPRFTKLSEYGPRKPSNQVLVS